MFNRFQLAQKYFKYYISASNGKGHGIHSPFVFDFVKHILNDKKTYPCYHLIESKRKALLNDSTVIDVTDFGAGSAVIKTNKRVVAAIARSSLKPKKYAQLLFRMVKYYKPHTIIELGTSFGITSAYLTSGYENSEVYTCEGSAAITAIAKDNFEALGLKNIQVIEGDFGITLSLLLSKLNRINFAFIDGNHRKSSTLDYFNKLLTHTDSLTILIIDDIHWSAEMEEVWTEIQLNPAVKLSIDLFFMGIVFVNTDINHKQHYTIRF